MGHVPTFRATVRIRNNRLIRAREVLGLTQAAAARAIGIQVSVLSAYECLTKSARAKRGGWTPTAIKVADYYGHTCEHLWPDDVDEVHTTTLSIEMEAAQLRQLGSTGPALLEAPQEAMMERAELHAAVESALGGLDKRTARLVRRWAEDTTFSELAAEEGLSVERVRQIVLKGLRGMRWAANSGDQPGLAEMAGLVRPEE
jgi:DNA-directed RNA polymerase sigma subunit (sigma70/sigma32)|uniref:Sigma-70 region 3 domain protein n=1 Tax=uncultured marine virus TaxID=186617 RepID=A0A0F7L6V6_9VIRU|nr:sigma-70 region 3 domain protein [uncultured marine virus]